MRKTRNIILATIASTIMICLAGCGSKAEEKGTKIIVNEVAHSVFYTPFYVALEEGYFEEEGIQIELITGFGADKTMTALLTEEADIGLMGAESTIYAYQQGAKDYVVNFALLTQRAGNFLVSRKEEKDFKMTDLRGKTVLGGRAGGMPEMVFETILQKYNLVPGKDVIIDQSIDFGATAAAFAGGQGDYTMEFEPYATMLEEQGAGCVVASLGAESGYIPYTSFCVKKTFYDEQKEVLPGFLKALKRGMEKVEKEDAEAISECIFPQFKDMNQLVLRKIIQRYKDQDSWRKDLKFTSPDFDILCQILLDQNVVQEKPEFEELVLQIE